MRDNSIIQDVIMPILSFLWKWLIAKPLQLIAKVISDIFKSFYSKLIAWLGGLALILFIGYIVSHFLQK
jgi:hypothetical protein